MGKGEEEGDGGWKGMRGNGRRGAGMRTWVGREEWTKV